MVIANHDILISYYYINDDQQVKIRSYTVWDSFEGRGPENKLSCRGETARSFTPLNISLHLRSFEMTPSRAYVSPY